MSKPGRPAHKPTAELRRQVETMAAFGNTEEQIAAVIGISDKTLRLHYRAELDLAIIKANNAVKANLFKQATKDDLRSVQAAIFWLRCRAGWSEYAPKPAAELGKKEIAAQAAEDAEHGTGWGDLLH